MCCMLGLPGCSTLGSAYFWGDNGSHGVVEGAVICMRALRSKFIVSVPAERASRELCAREDSFLFFRVGQSAGQT